MEGLKQEIADLIKVRVAAEGRGVHGRLKPLPRGQMPPPTVSGAAGPHISGTDLAKIAPIINQIDDEYTRNQVRGYFSMMTKFQALNIITNERSEICQRYPTIAMRIAEVATETERAVLENSKKDFRWGRAE